MAKPKKLIALFSKGKLLIKEIYSSYINLIFLIILIQKIEI